MKDAKKIATMYQTKETRTTAMTEKKEMFVTLLNKNRLKIDGRDYRPAFNRKAFAAFSFCFWQYETSEK